MSTGPVPRFPVGNSPIRGWRWYEFYPHGGLNGAEVIPVGDHGGGDGMQAPSPLPVGTRFQRPIYWQGPIHMIYKQFCNPSSSLPQSPTRPPQPPATAHASSSGPPSLVNPRDHAARRQGEASKHMRVPKRVCRCLSCTATASHQLGVADCWGCRSAGLGAALVSIRRLPLYF
jgi:hypothetical protein